MRFAPGDLVSSVSARPASLSYALGVLFLDYADLSLNPQQTRVRPRACFVNFKKGSGDDFNRGCPGCQPILWYVQSHRMREVQPLKDELA